MSSHLLENMKVPSLRCVFLNGCKTDVLAERIVKAAPTRHLQVDMRGDERRREELREKVREKVRGG